MKVFSAIFIALLLMPSCVADEAQPVLPPPAQAVIAEYTKTDKVAKTIYNATKYKAIDKAIQDLTNVLKKISARGDLDGAIAITQKINELQDAKDMLAVDPDALILVSAKYGVDTRWVDVLPFFKKLQGDKNSIDFDSANSNAIAGDPAVGVGKQMVFEVIDLCINNGMIMARESICHHVRLAPPS
jgi:hypothetical protein